MTLISGRSAPRATRAVEVGPGGPRRPAPARVAAAAGVGLVAGVTWGAAARVWMRWVSESPEFSWSGTLIILAMTGIAGTCLAVIDVLRRAGAGPGRLVLALPALVMFAGPGLVMLPAALLLGLAFSGRLRAWVAVLAAWLAQVSVVAVVEESAFTYTPYPRQLQVGGLMLLLLALGAGWRAVFARTSAA